MTPSEQIDTYFSSLPGWQGTLLKHLRSLIHDADPEIAEEWKWDVPVYTHTGMVCATSAFKDHVKMNFFKGVKLADPNKLINAGLDSKSHRAIDFSETDKPDDAGIKALVQEAVRLNTGK